MDLHQLRTFVAVAREGSVTRASERLHLSQPAVSAHVKALEDTLGLTLFERSSKGMQLTGDGAQLLAKAELVLSAQRGLVDEATRLKGRLAGRLELGGGSNSGSDAVLGHLLLALSDRHPEIEVSLAHGDSSEVVEGIVSGRLDGGFYNASDPPDPRLSTTEVSRFGIYVAAPPGTSFAQPPVNWQALADVPWICAPPDSCCGKAVERLFERHRFRPSRIIRIDREKVTLELVTAGVGLGLLHEDSALAARARGDVDVVCEAALGAQVLFAHLAARKDDPLLVAVVSAIEEHVAGAGSHPTQFR